MEFTKRQEKIIEIVRESGPITGDEIAGKLSLSRATIRPDLTILTMLNMLGARPKVGYFYTGKSGLSVFSKKVNSIKVKDTMSLPIVMDENSSIYDVIVGLFLDDMSSVFITNGGFLAGVVSRKDLLRTAMGKIDLNSTPIGLIMTRMPNIVYVTEDSSVLEAADKIEEKGVDSLPVVKVVDEELKKFKVVGRFTKTNVNRIFVELAKDNF
ncbi:CBS domain-containing protein [Anaerosphaera aminiphila DSM 21120]|uniref:CBS domain-containing protein n=1 Tax=Anaerosphaera aminiphila DSM 21120 TaxID=1120995 RepID=A0A1M5RJ89_9FIRM|nr:helix-turn-helix transcriptional regulator [Anaerosphaera aminiphila]SHH26149.1 CBS domain-containing protein [Anaerosphaera aminiphila DSM 21120]